MFETCQRFGQLISIGSLFFMCQVPKTITDREQTTAMAQGRHSLTLIEAKKINLLRGFQMTQFTGATKSHVAYIFFIGDFAISNYFVHIVVTKMLVSSYVCNVNDVWSSKHFNHVQAWANSMRATVDTSFPLKMEIFNILHIFDLLRKTFKSYHSESLRCNTLWWMS